MIRKKVLMFAVALAVTSPGKAADDHSHPMSDLDRYFSRLERVALEDGEIPLQAYGRDKFAQEVTRSQNLVESGKYGEATTVLSALLEGDMRSDWRTMLSTRVEILEKWANSGKIELSAYRRFFLNIGPQWFRGRIRPIVSLWRMENEDETEKLKLLLDLVRQRGDRDGEELLLNAIATAGSATADEAASALLEIGNKHYSSRDYDQAEASWLKVKGQFPGSAAWGKAVFNLGVLHKAKGQFAEAIHYFEQLVSADVKDLEPGGHIMEAYRNYRPRAQWEIGNCYFRMGDYPKALNAYQTTENKFPFQSWCGNALAEFEYRYDLYQGVCYEYLGDHRKAAVLYWQHVANASGLYDDAAIHLRLLDLYTATGRREALHHLLDQVDVQWRQMIAKYADKLDEETIGNLRPTATIRTALRIRTLGHRRQWPELIALLKQGDWQALQAAGELAHAPTETVPLLVDAVENAQGADLKWLYYALGRCDTPEALDLLVGRAQTERNIWRAQSLVYGLSIAGDNGKKRLEELFESATGNLKIAIQNWKNGIFAEDVKSRFPPLPKTADLPVQITEIVKGTERE